MKYIILDTETTCLTPDIAEIWQFSGKVLDFNNKNITVFNYNFRTKKEISFEAREKCNIFPETISDFDELDPNILLKELDIFNKDVYYVGHNISYDMRVISSVLSRHNIDVSNSNLVNNEHWIDTYRLAKRFYGSNKVTDITGENVVSMRLSYLFHYLHLYKENEVLDFHSASFDVDITLRLLRYICRDKNINISDSNSLVEQSNKPILLTIFTFGKYKGESILEVYNRHTTETDRYFQWLCSSDKCDINNINYDKDLYYTLEQL